MAPCLIIMAVLYGLFPRHLPKHARRRLFDSAVIVLSLAAAVVCDMWGYQSSAHAVAGMAGSRPGDMWPQVMSALYAYAGFTVVLLSAVPLRARLWPKPR
ncbi:hypothetical protein [Oleiagrimonas sp. C23AA]|uniref:hypothetical protein n=1 Tax=Oleiagrimonas sp. C23AA TaxID=2719047 RepID=UPI001424787A|nr:hypothetical protein [Oleiagrimonas sp. C23AA]NII11868.1 hypothetical protein [Oleiagrimonas sp. C23AA]